MDSQEVNLYQRQSEAMVRVLTRVNSWKIQSKELVSWLGRQGHARWQGRVSGSNRAARQGQGRQQYKVQVKAF